MAPLRSTSATRIAWPARSGTALRGACSSKALLMIEPMMYLVLGFCTASLIALLTLPLVHERAVRLTLRRMQDELPLSVAEMRADRDHLRAEFAMSTHRLERNVDLLRDRAAGLMADLGKQSATNSRLQMELGEKSAEISLFEGQMRALLGRLRAYEERLALGARSTRRPSVPQTQPVERKLARTVSASS
jgi:hypothetical protein